MNNRYSLSSLHVEKYEYINFSKDHRFAYHRSDLCDSAVNADMDSLSDYVIPVASLTSRGECGSMSTIADNDLDFCPLSRPIFGVKKLGGSDPRRFFWNRMIL